MHDDSWLGLIRALVALSANDFVPLSLTIEDSAEGDFLGWAGLGLASPT